MPDYGQSAQHYGRLKVGNSHSSKRDHFRPDPVPFDRPLTTSSTSNATVFTFFSAFRVMVLSLSLSGFIYTPQWLTMTRLFAEL